MKITKSFSDVEFACPCCGRCAMDVAFMERLQKARDLARMPFVITSGYRCEKHNKKVGGKADSSHLVGKAADIHTGSSMNRFVVVSAAIKAGFTRVGIAKDFVHVDTDDSKTAMTIWLY